MSDIPAIFDRRLRRSRGLRVAENVGQHAFLADAAARELGERLAAVNRPFPRALWHGPLPDALPSSATWTRSRSEAIPGQKADAVFDEDCLPLASQSIDLFVSAMNLHVVNDLPGALAQIRRALRPDGLFLAAFPGGQTLRELRTAFADAELELEGGISPRVHPAVDVRDAGDLLSRAGFALPVADSETLTVEYGDPVRLLADLRGMGEANLLVDRRRQFLRRHTLVRTLEIYRDRFRTGSGRYAATFEMIYLLGWAPHDSQQKPLRPGSATGSLADAVRRIGSREG